MPILEPVERYSARVQETNYVPYQRSIGLLLQSGERVDLLFVPQRPADWLQFSPAGTTIWMSASLYEEVYHLLQTEKPAFCTALRFGGFEVGAVHTEMDLSRGEPTGEGYDDTSLEALVVRYRAAAAVGA